MCSCKKVLIIFALLGLVLVVLGAVLGFAVFGNLVEDRIMQSVRLEKGTEQYERWEELPFPLLFKVYVFNVTNPDEILAGTKPNVKEIGPYVYAQYRNKKNITYDEQSDTLTYMDNQNYIYDADATYPLAEEDEITILNVPMSVVFQSVSTSTEINAANRGWKSAFNGTSLFHKISVKDYLFAGYKFCVGRQIISAGALCSNIRQRAGASKTLTVDPDTNEIIFSFFNHKNGSAERTENEYYEIIAGMDDIHQVGAITSWNDQQYLDTWAGGNQSICNRIRGRDSSIYPPFNNDTSNFDIFNTDICRILTLKYSGTAEYKGITGQVSKLGREAMSNNESSEDHACYCIKKMKNLDGKLECLPEGFGDMTTCLGSPVATSFPHLLWADGDYASTIDGLTPDEGKHDSFVNIQPDTGTPLNGAKRMQFNLLLRPIQGIEITESIKPAVFPLLWVEESFELPDNLVEKLKDDYLNVLVILDVITWVLIGVGMVLFIGCAGYYMCKRK